jgi:hypothetical protein
MRAKRAYIIAVAVMLVVGGVGTTGFFEANAQDISAGKSKAKLKKCAKGRYSAEMDKCIFKLGKKAMQKYREEGADPYCGRGCYFDGEDCVCDRNGND